MADDPRRRQARTLINRMADYALQGAMFAIMFVLLLVMLTILTGNQQARLLEQIRDGNRAVVCVLLLPVDDRGRDEGDTNSICLVPNGIDPVDVNRDGITET